MFPAIFPLKEAEKCILPLQKFLSDGVETNILIVQVNKFQYSKPCLSQHGTLPGHADVMASHCPGGEHRSRAELTLLSSITSPSLLWTSDRWVPSLKLQPAAWALSLWSALLSGSSAPAAFLPRSLTQLLGPYLFMPPNLQGYLRVFPGGPYTLQIHLRLVC